MTDANEGTDATYGADTTNGVEPRRASRGRRFAVGLGVIAVVAGGLFAVLALGSEENSPEDPVRAMFEAAERSDVLGVLAQLDPAEREVLQGPLADLVNELNRLDILKEADLGAISGIELDIEELELKSEEVDDDLAHVTVSNGRGRYRVDFAKLPLGGFIRELVGEEATGSTSGSDSLVDDDSVVTTVKRDGRWYVSIGYSMAEDARESSGFALSALGPGVPARGASTPEDAVRELVGAITELNVRRMIELMPPDELGALHDYAGMFLEAAENAVAEARETVTINVSTLELDSTTSGGEALVKVQKIEFDASADAQRFAFKDGCFDVSGEFVPPMHVCANDAATPLLEGFLGFGAQVPSPPKFSFEGKKANLGIVVTRVDGLWYVSPVRTVFHDLVASIELFERSDLEALRDWYQSLFESFGSSVGASGCIGPQTSTDGETMQQDCGYIEEQEMVHEEREVTATTYSEQ